MPGSTDLPGIVFECFYFAWMNCLSDVSIIQEWCLLCNKLLLILLNL